MGLVSTARRARRSMSGLKNGRSVGTAHLAAPTNETRSAPVQQQNTATSPDSNERELPPTPSMSWDSGQTPSGAASSGRRGRRARCVPDRPVNAGYLRSLLDSPVHRLTCGHAG